MHRLKIAGCDLPRVYVCDNRAEGMECRKRGVPFLIRPKGFSDEDVIRLALARWLREKFPYVKFEELDIPNPARHEKIVHVPGKGEDDPASPNGGRGIYDSDIVDIAEKDRHFNGSGEEEPECRISLDTYLGGTLADVSIEELQALHCLPEFLDDIAESAKHNLYSLYWMEGYNKKVGFPLGNYSGGEDRPNLLILDISGSIPRGVSATMLTLLESLAAQANAAVIVTGSKSMFWDVGDELPDPAWLRQNIGLSNEDRMFKRILKEHVFGRKWGNVICFGDNDRPWALDSGEIDSGCGTEVKRLLSFHTWSDDTPGYAKWIHELNLDPEEVMNCRWVRFIRKR